MNTIFSSIEIDNFPSLNSISVLLSVSYLILPATAVAHAAVPQAFVKSSSSFPNFNFN